GGGGTKVRGPTEEGNAAVQGEGAGADLGDLAVGAGELEGLPGQIRELVVNVQSELEDLVGAGGGRHRLGQGAAHHPGQEVLGQAASRLGQGVVGSVGGSGVGRRSVLPHPVQVLHR